MEDHSFIDGAGMPQQAPIAVLPGLTPAQQPRPAFRLVKLPARTREVTICKRDENGFTMKTEQVTDDAPYMVVMPKGHSVYISNLGELQKLKLAAYVPMLKPDDYEPMMTVPVDAVTVDKRNNKQ